MLGIRGFRKLRRGDGYLFEAHPTYHGCSFVLYGYDGSAVKDSRRIPLALVSLQSKRVLDSYEPVRGKIQKTKKEYIYTFDEEEADLEIVYANLLPTDCGNMKFEFRLEPNTSARQDSLLNKITVLRAGQNYTMTSSALGPNPHEFSSIRIQTKDSLLRKMGVTPKENLTNVDKYKSIKQQLIFDIIPSKSISKYFACGVELDLEDTFLVKPSHGNYEYEYCDGGGLDEVDGYQDDGPCAKDCLPKIPRRQQHLAEITAGKRMERPKFIPIYFDADEDLALSNICITLTGTDVSCKHRFMDYCME